MTAYSRRDALRLGICTGAAIAALPRRLFSNMWSERPYLDAALRAEHWIRSTAVTTSNGRSWPCTPGDATRGSPEYSLYSGTPGVILGYLELHAHTGDRRFLAEAEAGALDLAARIPDPGAAVESAGLYAGVAGQLFVLREVHKAGGRKQVRTEARRAARTLAVEARKAGEVNDIISGTAGVGLALLALRDLLGDEAIELARAAGDRLIAAARPVAEGQRKWMMDPTFPREMPNFSHGTAGVAYFLATLSRKGGEPRHLEAARDGARYLKSIAVPSGDGSVIRHHDGDGAELFYLGWCHGGAGTSRLWERLFAIDHDPTWRAAEEAGARGIIAQGVPERRTAGFWNNVSRCCGNTGVAEYFLTRYARTGATADLDYARRQADDLLHRGTVLAEGERWIQAENRVSPAEVTAQTGLMQGAAGVAMMLLHLDAAIQRRPLRPILLPDAFTG